MKAYTHVALTRLYERESIIMNENMNAIIITDADANTVNLDADTNANIRARLIATLCSDVMNVNDTMYDVVCNADTLTIENCYFKILRHSSHKSFCQIYCKKSYVLVLISRHSVDAENDSYQHDTNVCERISDQSCYARYKVSYSTVSAFFKSLVAYDTRKQTSTTSATEISSALENNA